LAGYAQLSFVIYAIFGWICAIGVRWKYTPYGVYLGVVRKAERQDNEEEIELMMDTFLNPAPRTPAIHGELKNKRGAIK